MTCGTVLFWDSSEIHVMMVSECLPWVLIEVASAITMFVPENLLNAMLLEPVYPSYLPCLPT